MRPSMGTTTFGLAVLSSAATIPLIDNINLSDDNIPTLNASTLVVIDPRFTMTHQYNRPTLDENQCLMNIVFALSELSRLDFTSSTEPFIGINPSYPDVVIVQDTLGLGSTIETRFIIWGLYVGATLMMAQNVFTTVEFMLHWDGVAVGRIRLVKPPWPPSLGGSSTTDVLVQKLHASSTLPITVGTSTNDSYTVVTTNTPDNPEIHRLTVEFTGFRNPLPKYDVYMAVMKAQIHIAENNDRDELRPFATVATRPYNAILRLTQLTPRQPRGEVFSYKWASRALPAVPQTLMQLGSWCEARFEVVVDGVPIGEGALSERTR